MKHKYGKFSISYEWEKEKESLDEKLKGISPLLTLKQERSIKKYTKDLKSKGMKKRFLFQRQNLMWGQQRLVFLSCAGVERAEVTTNVLLEARDKVLRKGGRETVFAIAGVVTQTTAKINEFIEVTDGMNATSSGVEGDGSGQSVLALRSSFRGRSDAQVGEAHSHLPRHQFELSSADKAEIERRRGNAHQKVFFLFHNKGNGGVAFKAFDENSRRIPISVTSHVTGESRVSDGNTPPSSWGESFWGIDSAA